MTGIIIATSGVLFRKALPKATGGRILAWAVSRVLGRPMSFSLIIVIAPVLYMPAATMKSAPIVNTPGLEKPLRLASRGASLKVIVRVSAPRNTAAGGTLVKTSSANVVARIPIINHTSNVMTQPPCPIGGRCKSYRRIFDR